MNNRIVRNNSMLNLSEIDPSTLLTNVQAKGNFTDKICAVLNYLTFLPSLIYAICFVVFFQSIFSEIDLIKNGEFPKLLETGCPKIHEYLDFSFAYTIFCLSKSIIIVLLFCFLCTGGGDCYILYVILKILFSFIPSAYIFFSFDLDNLNTNICSFDTESNYKKGEELCKSTCAKMLENVHSFYNMEKGYFWFISCLFLMSIIGIISIAFKELFKGKNYLKKE